MIQNAMEEMLEEMCGKIESSYYVSQDIYKVNWENKTTELSLYNTNFQNKILNSENAFQVNEMVEQGYFPKLIMPNCMPLQEFISLPEVQDDDLPDILYTEVLEKTNKTAKIRVTVNNPSAETVTDIKVKDIECEILSQEYELGVSDVIIELQNPVLCISQYSILSLSTKGVYNLTYTRNFKENERNIVIDFYREIDSLEDWYGINTSTKENYILMEDLDFINNGNRARITNEIQGKIDGNHHQINNIMINNNLFNKVRN